ncbi:MAG TPA: MmcQ/YjbR family DNA-binding protein [Paracoccaceae bacterium]|nr:MmcQ/YjbR family DNA-binding protein [Paracoccaceae bacterium]
MTRDEVNAFCAALPGSELSDPWGGGHDCWKVGGKMYALMGAMNAGVSLKCADDETARLLIELGRAEKAPYLTRGGWILVPWGRMPDEELRERLATSYRTVRQGLPRRVQAALGPVPA